MASDGPLYTHDLLAIVATDIFVEMMARPPAEKNRTAILARLSA
jgi:hypothetical protein